MFEAGRCPPVLFSRALTRLRRPLLPGRPRPSRGAAADEARTLGGRWATAAALVGLVALSLVLRTREIGGPLWIDEAISAGVAGRPLSQIPGLLAQDGSPPLYYALLHVWSDLAGSGDAAIRVPSLLAALATIPAALWVGSRLFGARAGWIAAAGAAVSPFLTDHAQEARMYALVALLALLAAGAFLAVAAHGRRRAALGLGLTLALLLYTHNWGIFLVVGMLAALPVAVPPGRRLAGALHVGLALAGAAAAFAPWLPTLIAQAQHTGAPWASRPPLGAIAVAAAIGLAAPLLARLGRGSAEQRATAALAVLVAATLAAAFLAASLERMWAGRYLAVIVGPLVLLGGAVAARLGTLGLTAALALGVVWSLHQAPELKSNVAAAVAIVEARIGPGDLVISTQPEQVPVLARYLPPGPRFATPLGPVREVGVPDWREALARLWAATPQRSLVPLLDGLPAGAAVLLATPTDAESRRRSSPWTGLVHRLSGEWRDALDADARFVLVPMSSPPERGSRTDVTLAIYRKDPR